MTAGKFSALRSAFSNRNYAIYMGGNCISLIGYWMQRLAVGWLTWETSHSEFWVGAVAFAEICPLIFVGPFFGVYSDRFDRKILAIIIQTLMTVQAFILFAYIWLDMLSIGVLFTLTLVEGVIQAAYQPVRLALIPNLVRKADLVAAAAFTAVSFNVARFLGPAIAGVVISLYSPAWAVLFNAVTYLLIIFAWYFIKLPPTVETAAPKQSLLRDMRAGMTYIQARPALFSMFLMMTIVALFARPLTYLLTAFVGAVYKAGPETLALFTSAVGVGAVVAGLLLSMHGHTKGLIRNIMLNTLSTVICMMSFASINNIWLAAVLLFGFGYSLTVCTVSSQTLVQTCVDDAMRGRVLSLWVAFTRGAPALGVLVIGWFSNHFGLMWPNVVAALLCLCGMLLMVKQRKAMRLFFEKNTD